MKLIYRLLEAFTLICWFSAILISCSGGSIKLIAGIVLINAGLWVIILALTAYIGTKLKQNEN